MASAFPVPVVTIENTVRDLTQGCEFRVSRETEAKIIAYTTLIWAVLQLVVTMILELVPDWKYLVVSLIGELTSDVLSIATDSTGGYTKVVTVYIIYQMVHVFLGAFLLAGIEEKSIKKLNISFCLFALVLVCEVMGIMTIFMYFTMTWWIIILWIGYIGVKAYCVWGISNYGTVLSRNGGNTLGAMGVRYHVPSMTTYFV